MEPTTPELTQTLLFVNTVSWWTVLGTVVLLLLAVTFCDDAWDEVTRKYLVVICTVAIYALSLLKDWWVRV
jgi:hypothetical protein